MADFDFRVGAQCDLIAEKLTAEVLQIHPDNTGDVALRSSDGGTPMVLQGFPLQFLKLTDAQKKVYQDELDRKEAKRLAAAEADRKDKAAREAAAQAAAKNDPERLAQLEKEDAEKREAFRKKNNKT